MELQVNFSEKVEGNFLRLSSWFEHDNFQKEIWFTIPLEFADFTSKLADPFLLALLFPAMEWNRAIVINGKKVSKGLLINLLEFQRAWHKWRPEKYSIIHISAEESDEAYDLPEEAISAFTGGVDGAFILHQNLVSPPISSFPVTASLFVHGFDIPLEALDDFEKTLVEIGNVTTSLNIPLINIQCNLRDFGDWNDTHAAAIIACLTLFNRRFKIGLLGSSHPYDYLRFPWGSNPITDPLLSSKNFKVYNYGGGFSRVEKLEVMVDWSVFNRYLRVCTKYFYKNCGVCEKCVRTKLGYWTLNKDLPPTFVNKSFSALAVARILAFKEQEIKDYRGVYNLAKTKYGHNLVIYSLAISLQINRLIHYLNFNLFRNVSFSPKLIRVLKRLFVS
jgi:hypothetical protein